MRLDKQFGIWCFTMLATWWVGVLWAAKLPALRISENNRYLITEDGKPFFWLGDTAWSLFERLNREDADLYLENRARKGFTVIQAVLIFGGGVKPNAYGHPPLLKDSRGRWAPSRPNEECFRHVDYIVNKAESLGLYIGMLPVWASSNVRPDGRLFNLTNLDQARAYGRFLGRRYCDKPIVWVLGGDYPPEGVEAVWRSLAEGLAADLRLSGQETTKGLVGSPELGEPTSYAIKVAVKAIRMLAAEFARNRDDEEFLGMINRAMASEAETMKKRFGPKVAA